MAVLLSVVFVLLVYTGHVTGQTLCDTDGVVEVVENATSKVLTCTDIKSTYTVEWILKAGDATLAECPPRTTACNNYFSPAYTASRPASDTSTLTLDGSTTSLNNIRGKTIICKQSLGTTSSHQTECQVDSVAIPSVTCDAHYNTGTSSPWTVTVNCSVSGAYSYLNRYTCQLVQTSPSTKNLGSVNMTVTSTSGKYKSGTCDVTVSYPDVTGVYSYKMVVTPGRKNVSAMFGGQSSFTISRPSTQSSHTCPQYVQESQGASCTCTATDLGQPPGVVRWTSTGTNQLSLSNVNRNQDGTEYTCEVMWNRQRVQSVKYTLQVAYGPSSVSISQPPSPFDTDGQQQLTLTCSSDGNPAPTFTWRKGSNSNIIGQGNTYTFTPQPSDDNAMFVCQAANTATGARQQDTVTLTLNYPPTENPVITNTTASSSQGHFNQGDRVTLICSVTGGKPFNATKVTFTCPRKQDRPDSVGSSGVSSTVTFDNLTAADHNKVCTCTTRWKNKNWYKKNEQITLFVSYQASLSSFTVNSRSTSALIVTAGDALSFACHAVGRPPPEMKLIHSNQSLIARIPLGLVSVDDTSRVVRGELTALCRHSGVYTCIVDNTVGQVQQQTILVFVKCSPKLAEDAGSREIPYVNLDTDVVHLNFDIVGYPTPQLKSVRYFLQLPSADTDGQPVLQFQVDVTCTLSCVMSSVVKCRVTVYNVTESAVGFYRAVVGNEFGDLSLTFEIREKISSAEISGRIGIGATVGISVAAMIVLDVIVIAFVVVWLWRRDWILPCAEAEAKHVHKDGETEQGRRPDTQQQVPPPQFNEERSQRNTGVYELQDIGEPTTPKVTHLNAPPSDYDVLQTSDIGLRSIYTCLPSPYYNAGASGDAGPSYVNNSETSPVYVNKDNSETSPVYVNKDNSETSPVYVNKDNSETSPVSVNKDNSETSPVYVN